MDIQPRVLVIDADTAALTSVASVAEEEGFCVSTAMDADGAMRQCRVAYIDLVLIDIGLPGIDGLEVIRRLRKDRPGLAAFLITGYADPNLTARAADLGVVGFVLKPFDDSSLLFAIGCVTGRVDEAGAE